MTSIALRALALPLLVLPLAGCDDPTAWRDVLPVNWYYVPSTSMEPTLAIGDRFSATSVSADDLSRGDIVIVETSRGEDYVKRLVGLPGDTVALENGIVILNDEPIEQSRAGRHIIEDEEYGPQDLQRLKEQFPGEKRPHFILDERSSFGDEYGPVILGDNQYFLLGDNRDNAADSRFGEEARGLGLVAGSQITRKVAVDKASN